MPDARVWTMVVGISAAIGLAACSPDRSGLGPTDGGGSGGTTPAPGSGGAGAQGMGSGGAGPAGTGGAFGSGGANGTGGVGSGGARTGGARGGGRSGSGGVETGGRIGSGGSATGGRATGGSATGGRGTGGSATGGSATGGRATGGSATGGSATGGRGTGGSAMGGRGTGGSAEPKAECTTASDCRLYSDCCTCRALPVGEQDPPMCPLVCIQSDCAAKQLPQGAVDCVAGRCVAGFNCDSSQVVCGSSTPDCPAGEVPNLNPSGSCYTGGCVPASQCRTVKNCDACGGSAPACVIDRTELGPEFHCVTIPTQCGDAATCDCLGPTTCLLPYDTCTDFSGARGVACSCPNC